MASTEQSAARFSFEDYIRPTPEGACIQFSKYDLDSSSPFAGGCAWIEGEFKSLADARISIFDMGYGHSDLTYTVAQVWHGNYFRLQDHLDRLLWGAERLHLEAPMTKTEISEICHQVAAKSQLRESFVSIQITRGFGPRPGEKDLKKLSPQLYVYAIPYLWAVPLEAQLNGASVIVAQTVRRVGRGQIDPQVKNFQWGDLTKGIFEAQGSGAHTSILLDADGLVAEASGHNVIVIKEGALASPQRNALAGVTRSSVERIATEMGLPFELRDVEAAELYNADEVMLATTAGGVTPVVELDGRSLGDGTPGKLTGEIRDRYWALMDDISSPWIEPVNY